MEPAMQISLGLDIAAVWDALLLIAGAGIGAGVSRYYARKSSRELAQHVEALAMLEALPLKDETVRWDPLLEVWLIEDTLTGEVIEVPTFAEALQEIRAVALWQVETGHGGARPQQGPPPDQPKKG
jgi:hypothetical protein